VSEQLTLTEESYSLSIVEDNDLQLTLSGERGPAGADGAAGAAGPNTLTTATTTNLDGFISGNGTNISGATAATSTATANTLVLRSAGGGASFAGLTLSGVTANSGSYAQIGGLTFNVATTSNANLTTTGSGTVIVSGAGGTTIGGGTLTFSPSGFAYGTGAASAHRTALGLGEGDVPIFSGVRTSTIRDATNGSLAATIGQYNFIIYSGRFQFGAQLGAPTLWLDGTGVLSQRSGTTQQELRIHGTYTDNSNYRRLALKMSSAGVAQIVAEGGGSGASGNRIEIDGLRIGKGGSNIATNTALGASALNANTSGGNNTAVGRLALRDNTTGNGNSAFGSLALSNNTAGYSNSAVGIQALANNATGNGNSAFGHQALIGDMISSNNTAIGAQALLNHTSGNSNTAVGSGALSNATSGAQNTVIGTNAGRLIADGTTSNTVTSNSVYLGVNTKALASGQTNQIVIGFDAIGLGSNTAVLGNDSIETTALKGDVGIGTTSPAERLDVVGNIKASDTISAYGTYTDGSNYRRLALKMSSAGVAQIVAEGGGGGAADNRLEFVTGGTTRATISAAGVFSTTITAEAPSFHATNGLVQYGLYQGVRRGGLDWKAASNTGLMVFTGNFAQYIFLRNSDGNVGIGTTSPAERLDVVGNIKASGTIQTGGYAFADLPTSPTTGMRAYITDGAALPLYMANAAGGGSTVTPVFYDGTNWINA
jgi:hypothetical protein